MRKLEVTELNRISAEEFKTVKKMPLVVVLDNVRSLHNVGSVFRTSDAFLIEKIILCGITSTPPNAEIHKTALGAEYSVDWEYFEETTDAIHLLKNEGYYIYSIEQVENSVMLDKIQLDPDSQQKYAVVLGNEVHGVDQEVINLSDNCIEIPQFGTKHSLNVSVSAGLIIWKFFEILK
jgi:tRNA G18 (ribose-2'-O)-methylase SpoU